MTSIPSPTSDLPEAQRSSIADVLSDKLKSFDHEGIIIEPFDNEAKRDTEFSESGYMRPRPVRKPLNLCTACSACIIEMSEMLIELMLEFHAWSTSRPAHEGDETADKLEKEISAVMETEKEQGRSPTSSLYTTFVGTPTFCRQRSLPTSPPLLAAVLTYLLCEERTRQRLREFVERIKVALAALADL